MNIQSKGLIGLLLAALTSTVAAQSVLFSVERTLAKTEATHLQSWEIEIAAGALDAASPSILLPIPGKVPQLALRTAASVRGDGFVWHGRIGDKPVLVSVLGKQVHASFDSGLEHYTISAQAGQTVLALIDRGETPEDALTPAPRLSAAQIQSTKARAESKNEPDPIRVLVPYTASALAAAGSEQQIVAAAQFMVDQSNAIIASSVLASIRIELAGTMPIGYVDNLSSDSVLATLREDPEVALRRDELAADVVIAIVEQSDFAGRAYMPNLLHVGNAPYAFGMVRRDAGLSMYTFTHELGHIFGLDHGGASGAGGGAFPWARGHIGYVDSASGYPEGFVTVMAQIGFCGGSPPCYVVPYFSNPELTSAEAPVRGRALGLVDEADNARAFREAAAYISQYRDETLPELFGTSFEAD